MVITEHIGWRHGKQQSGRLGLSMTKCRPLTLGTGATRKTLYFRIGRKELDTLHCVIHIISSFSTKNSTFHSYQPSLRPPLPFENSKNANSAVKDLPYEWELISSDLKCNNNLLRGLFPSVVLHGTWARWNGAWARRNERWEMGCLTIGKDVINDVMNLMLPPSWYR